jgi:hypothetical protein
MNTVPNSALVGAEVAVPKYRDMCIEQTKNREKQIVYNLFTKHDTYYSRTGHGYRL